MGYILPNATASEFGFGTVVERFLLNEIAFPPGISNNTSETVTRVPVTFNSQFVMKSEHQEILNVLDVAILESERFASQDSRGRIHESKLRKVSHQMFSIRYLQMELNLPLSSKFLQMIAFRIRCQQL